MKEATTALRLALEVLEWINRVNAMDYEYQQKAREALNAIYEALAPTSTQCEVQDELCSSQEPVAWEQFYPDIGTPQLGQEPVGWQYREANDDGTWRAWIGCDKRLAEDHWRQVRAIYIAAPKEQQSCNKRPWGKPWVSLTDAETADCFEAKVISDRLKADAKRIEAKLKEKNT